MPILATATPIQLRVYNPVHCISLHLKHASSRIRIRLSFTRARARDTREHWPMDELLPLSSTGLSSVKRCTGLRDTSEPSSSVWLREWFFRSSSKCDLLSTSHSCTSLSVLKGSKLLCKVPETKTVVSTAQSSHKKGTTHIRGGLEG